MDKMKWLRRIGPFVVLVLLIGGWDMSVRVFEIQQMILPSPMQVASAFVEGFQTGVFQKHLKVTGLEVVVGYLGGVFLGIAIGAPIALSRVFEALVYPYILALQTMPKIALAPLMMIWVGFGIESKIIITLIVALFPVLVNTVVGLRSVDPERINLIRSLKGGVWSEFWWVRLPSAAPFIFAGMKTAIVLALLGAIAAEFVGAEAGMGYLLTQQMFQLDTPGVFSVLLLLGGLGVVLFLIADWAQRRVVFWDRGSADRWGSK